jgi:hypothetical protein
MLRIVYEVDISTNPEVSMSKLRAPNERPTKVTKVKKNATSSKVESKPDDTVEPQEEGQLAEHSEHSMDNDDDDEMSQPSSPKFAKTSQGGRKFDLISSLEQKYGGGAHYADEDEDEEEDESSRGSGRSPGQVKKRKKKRNVDDEW